MLPLHEPLKNRPKNRVELHVHLDGAVRPETLWEVMRAKKLKLPGDGSLTAFRNSLIVKEPVNLEEFLKPFFVFAPAYVGDLDVIERISREFVEDRAKDSVAYCEARFCPHLMIPHDQLEETKESTDITNGNGHVGNSDTLKTPLTPDDVVEAVLRGIRKGEADSEGTKVRLILCCIRGSSQWSWDILRLCEKYKDKGVVAIDLAGDEAHYTKTDRRDEEEIYDPIEKEVFKAAKEKGIHRTVHAGEAAGPESVEMAVNELYAERIGHGYRVIEQWDLPEACRDKGIHFEVCPHSSYYTGTMKQMLTSSKRHPILQFSEEGFSFSISTDDPSLTGTSLNDEYSLLRSWGFNEAQFTKANFDAAKNSFLPYNEKLQLITDLKKAYCIDDLDIPKPKSKSSAPTSNQPAIIKVEAWEDRR